MKKPLNSVSSFLYASPHANRNASLDLGFGRSCAIWTNVDDHVRYDQLEGHTFSFYAKGGEGVWRIDEKPVEGRPGTICIFPHGQSSEWLVSKPLEMVHLYLPDAEIRRMFSEWTDRDGRMLNLADVTYAPAGALEEPFQTLLAALLHNDPICADSGMMQLLERVIVTDPVSALRMKRLKGGLAPVVRRRLVDYIEANLDQVIKLKDLADIAGLSEFHLQRSFKESCGVSPQAFMAHRRVERAKERIKAGEPLVQVASVCGFSSQSHMTRNFKAGTGMTPAAFRKALV